MEKIKVNVPKMVCEGCVENITKALDKLGIKDSDLKFNLDDKSVEISMEKINEKKILKTLKRSKYPAEIINT